MEAIGDVVIEDVRPEVTEDVRLEVTKFEVVENIGLRVDGSTVSVPSILDRMDVVVRLVVEEGSTKELDAKPVKDSLMIRNVLTPVLQSQLSSLPQQKTKVPLSLVQRSSA